jgi:hypothetical protein
VRRGRDHVRKLLVREDDGVSLGCRGTLRRGGRGTLAALYRGRGSWGGKMLTMCRLPGDRVGDRGLGIQIPHQRST